MECPVCKALVSETDPKKCKVCATDLEIYNLLGQIERKSAWHRRSMFFVMILLILFLLAAGSYFFIFSDRNANRYETAEATIRQQQIEIQNLNNEKQVLMASLLELRQEVQTLKLGLEEKAEKVVQAAEPDQPAYREIIHVVKRGESLQRIAKKYYGSGDQYHRILQDNNIRNPNHIHVNQRLKIIVPANE
jgi:nucleoid-associated protein YgaU